MFFWMEYRYLEETYSQYHAFLDGSASLDIDNFLKSGEQEFSFFAKVITTPGQFFSILIICSFLLV